MGVTLSTPIGHQVNDEWFFGGIYEQLRGDKNEENQRAGKTLEGIVKGK